ncbi:hypothetical protein [Rhizobium sp. 007]|uniref:hypothetical protein n=1 Tax=Rhizobium sp. 007 TaxID=2785056 RepID=UPI00189037E7|nr:hypothetical protein [Rhizobium sp. 007]QPB23728.1 hypothetical protein ISN39_30170 [Rhizobium sp. 007]
MHDEDRDQKPDYLEERLDRRRHAISDYFVGLALFAFSILAMAIGLDSAPAHTTSASDRRLSAFVIARPATPCIDGRKPAGGSSEAMRLRHVPNINTILAPRKVSSRLDAITML